MLRYSILIFIQTMEQFDSDSDLWKITAEVNVAVSLKTQLNVFIGSAKRQKIQINWRRVKRCEIHVMWALSANDV